MIVTVMELGFSCGFGIELNSAFAKMFLIKLLACVREDATRHVVILTNVVNSMYFSARERVRSVSLPCFRDNYEMRDILSTTFLLFYLTVHDMTLSLLLLLSASRVKSINPKTQKST